MVGVAVFTIVNAGDCTAVTVSVSVGEVDRAVAGRGDVGHRPASRSAWVIVYDAVHVIDAPGARLAVAGQDSSVALSSLTVNGPDNVTLPVLVTR